MSMDDFLSSSAALTVIEEPAVEQAIDAAAEEYPHAFDMFQAAAWRIARQPECGIVIDEEEPFRRIVKLVPIQQSKNPVMLIRYYIDGEDVVVDWIKVSPYDDRQAISPPAFTFKP